MFACRAPEGAAMLARITQLINSVLADVEGAGPLTEQDVIDLIGAAPLQAQFEQLPLVP
jgi:hypothetical protein